MDSVDYLIIILFLGKFFICYIFGDSIQSSGFYPRIFIQCTTVFGFHLFSVPIALYDPCPLSWLPCLPLGSPCLFSCHVYTGTLSNPTSLVISPSPHFPLWFHDSQTHINRHTHMYKYMHTCAYIIANPGAACVSENTSYLSS